MRSLSSYLDTDDADEEELESKQDDTVPGTCEWLLKEASYVQWRDRSPHSPARQTFWLIGDPGSGKSFIAAHVINDLRLRGCDVSFYFLKHGDQSKQQISGLLKSMTLQTARRSAGLRRSLLALQKEDLRETFQADKSDLHGITKQLLKRTFAANLDKHQYWIIDALDEANGGGDKLLTLLPKFPSNVSVFITCRPDPSLTKKQRSAAESIVVREITQDDTRQDIMLYLRHNAENLPAANGDPAQMQSLIGNLTRRSQGSFLWTSLVVQELEECFDDVTMQNVLSNVPTGMHDRYKRMLQNIEQYQKPHNVELARNILRWVVTSTRPLRLVELRGALQFEKKNTVFPLQHAIETICSPLLKIVGSDNDRVEVIHDTARDYLFNRDRRPRASVVAKFTFDKATSHEHLATMCIEALNERYRSPQRGTTSGASPDDEAFIAYASKSFSVHVYKSAQAAESHTTARLVAAIKRFLEAHLTSWIQAQAADRTLSFLTETGKNLKAFAARRLSSVTELGNDIREIPSWADDLIHLVTVFGKDLLKDPGAIHTLIPPLCPYRSKLRGAYSGNGLRVEGLSNEKWPDHISSASFGRNYLTALACRDTCHVVALRSCEIVVFSAITCQEKRRFTVSEMVKLMDFVPGKDWIAVSGRTSLALYNAESGEKIWAVHTGNEIMALAITPDKSRIITYNRERLVRDYDLRDGRMSNERRLKSSGAPNRSLESAHIACDLGLIALVHRNAEVEIYDWPSFRREERRVHLSSHVTAIAFNHAKHFLALTSFDGELYTVDASTMRKVNEATGNAAHMAVSPDGRTLVLGDNTGDICIHDFETLELLHRIQSDDGEIIGLCYADSNLRFLDIRRNVCNVWEPAALVRQDDYDDSGSSEGHSAFATALSKPEYGSTEPEIDYSPITAFVAEGTGDFMFCGREDGGVRVYDTHRGRCRQALQGFGRNEIVLLSWNQAHNLLASADNSSTVRIHRVTMQRIRGAPGTPVEWQARELAKLVLEMPLRQILFSVEGDLLLASTTAGQKVFRVDGGKEIYSHDNTVSHDSSEQLQQKWVISPEQKRKFLEVSDDGGHVLSWGADLTQGLRRETLQLQASSRRPAGGAHMTRVQGKLWAVYGDDPIAPAFIWPQAMSAKANSVNQVQQTLGAFQVFASHVSHVFGLHRTNLVFVDTDNWVCSVPIDRPRYDQEPRHHFPIPHYWRSANRSLLVNVTRKGDVAFAVSGDLVMVKNGLDQHY